MRVGVSNQLTKLVTSVAEQPVRFAARVRWRSDVFSQIFYIVSLERKSCAR